ncbi:MAG TPA: hopanoid biosynthesis-associated protein HpnK [Burkholderiaceae bacterium]|jgi:hopanoid biosynthesis associated protein HpnK|nr:hopanoid biosynthesis-associated protein HpnK [Burkholderiaceae bacterium]
MRHLIVTADDFGLDLAINEAVERAYTEGVLTAASLMVGQPAADDAVQRARRLPGLRVGLHVTLTGARPVLAPQQLPDLVDEQGRLPGNLARLGWRLACSACARRQAEQEIHAQFQAFADTGLALDHANAHQHYHMHPFVLDRMLHIGARFGLRAVRVPFEPLWLARSVPASASRAGRLSALGWALGTGWMRRRLRRAGLACNDVLFGLRCTGRLDEAALCDALEQLPTGVAEVYLHPATRCGPREQSAGVGAHASEEFEALLSARVRQRLQALSVSVGGFVDIPGQAPALHGAVA